MSPFDVAWLAGLLEGEGHFGLTTTTADTKKYGRKTYQYPKVQLQMTDLDVVERAAALMECAVLGPYQYFEHKKPFWNAHVGKSERALSVMRAVYPQMSLRRRARIREIHTILGRELVL